MCKVEVGSGIENPERSALPERKGWERELRFDGHLNIYWAKHLLHFHYLSWCSQLLRSGHKSPQHRWETSLREVSRLAREMVLLGGSCRVGPRPADAEHQACVTHTGLKGRTRVSG